MGEEKIIGEGAAGGGRAGENENNGKRERERGDDTDDVDGGWGIVNGMMESGRRGRADVEIVRAGIMRREVGEIENNGDRREDSKSENNGGKGDEPW